MTDNIEPDPSNTGAKFPSLLKPYQDWWLIMFGVRCITVRRGAMLMLVVGGCLVLLMACMFSALA